MSDELLGFIMFWFLAITLFGGHKKKMKKAWQKTFLWIACLLLALSFVGGIHYYRVTTCMNVIPEATLMYCLIG